MNRIFTRSFWVAAVIGAAVPLLGVHLWWSGASSKSPHRPQLPWIGKDYVSIYGSLGSVSHYIYEFGMFGTGDRLRQSDVLLIGSSHTESGISAAALSRDLSEYTGKPVRVYDMGATFGEGIGFASSVMRNNRITGKSLVIDLFSGQPDDRISRFGRTVNGNNMPQAYAKVINVWLTCLCEWLLDPVAPRISLHNNLPPSLVGTPPADHVGQVEAWRFLGMMGTRSWASGDGVDLWQPNEGSMIVRPAKAEPYNNSVTAYSDSANRGVGYSPFISAALKEFNSRAIYTLIPFGGFLQTKVPPEATPFVPIAVDGLLFFDSLHLTAQSRAIATERLFSGMKRMNLIEAWLSPGRPSY